MIISDANKSSGTVLGGVLLISGSCIGVGMLALPVLTSFAGFLPTFVIFCLCWALMTCTALLMLEANLWFPHPVNIVTLAETTLGFVGKLIAWTAFAFLFYCLLVAYIVKGGEIVQEGLVKLAPQLPAWSGSFLIAIASAIFVFLGTRIVDHFNRFFMLFLFFAYMYLVSAGIKKADFSFLTKADWSYSLFILPFIVTSFGYHNMVSTLSEYLLNDRKKMIKTVIIGGLIPFFIFLLWILKIQMIVPFDGAISLKQSYIHGEISTQPLAQITQNPLVSVMANLFAFFAIVTSLLGQSLSMVDFLADGLKLPKKFFARFLLCLLTFLPPFIFSQLFPHVFFKALELAGGVAAVTLFGILPPCIVWVGRYHLNLGQDSMLGGGKITLTIIFISSLFVVCYEIYKNLLLI